MRTPLAPIGWPNDLSPPLGFTGMSPSSAVRPSSTSFPPSPFLQKPRSSMFEISVQVKQSCTSATSRARAVILPAAYAWREAAWVEREQRESNVGWKSGLRDATAAAVLQRLGAEHEDDVGRAGREREAAVAEGVSPRRAVVLDARDGAVVEAQRVGERDRRLPPAGAGEIRAQVGGLDLVRLDARVGVGLEGGVADELLEAPLVAIAELRATDPDDRYLVLHHVSAGRAFQK